MAMIRLIADPVASDVDIHLVKPKRQRTAVPLLNNGMKIEELNTLEQDFYTETLPDGKTINWILPNKKTFPEFINTFFGTEYVTNKHLFLKSIEESTDESPPFPYQMLIRDYLRFGTPYRSLLLEHGVGSGKSRSAIMVAETFRKQGLPILILTPAFLRLNFMDEIHKWGGEDIQVKQGMTAEEIKSRQHLIDRSYHFVHYNATGYSVGRKRHGEDIGGKGGVFEQLARLGIGFPEDSKFGHLFPYLNKKYGPLNPPSNMLIIIEEIHNLNRTFIAGNLKSNLKFYMYPLLLMASDCKIIGLSGTPVVSSAFEMATLYNVLRGPIKTAGGEEEEFALPQSELRFNELFIDFSNLSLINTSLFMSRIIGLSSMFKGVTTDDERLIFPAGQNSPIIEELQMSPYQSRVHDEALVKELSGRPKPRKAMDLWQGDFTGNPVSAEQSQIENEAAYYTGSRQAINFAFPEEIPRPRPRDKVHGLENYDFEFSSTPGEIYKQFQKQGVDLSAIKEAYLAADNDGKRQILSHIFKQAYPKISPEKDEAVWSLLSREDQRMITRNSGGYKARMQAAIQKMVEKPEQYFRLDNLKKYSVKMARIYSHIVGNIEHGAPHLVPVNTLHQEADVAVCKEYEEALMERSVDEAAEDEDDLDIEDLTAKDLTSGKITDPDDDLPKYMDVFKTDEELARMKKRVMGGPALVYSFFNAVEGVGIFSKVLEAHGFAAFTDASWDGTTPFNEIARQPRYAFIKGGMNPRLKAKIMRVFNSRENRHGQLIRVVFVTQAAAEGISLYHLRQIHIMEPHWDHVMIEQVIGRGFRLRSHRYLTDKLERKIQIFHYFAKRSREVPPEYFDDVKISHEQPTVDYIIRSIADRKAKIVLELKKIRGAAAIDCKINRDYNQMDKPCFDFQGDASGKAFSSSLDADVKSSMHTQVKKTESVVEFKTFELENDKAHGKGPYVWFSKERKDIKITSPSGESITMNVGVFYSGPANWRTTDPVVINDFIKRGYVRLNNNRPAKTLFFDEIKAKNIKVEELT